jgi:hypothetical protein
VRGDLEFVPVLNDLTGYTVSTREAYQRLFRELAGRLVVVTIVGGSPLVRMAASAVCLYAGIRMRTATDLDDLRSSRGDLRAP